MDHMHKHRHEHLAHLAARQATRTTSTTTTSTTTTSSGTSSTTSKSSSSSTTSSTSSTPTTYATTPPLSQNLVWTTPGGVGSYAQKTTVAPKAMTSNYMPAYSSGYTVKSGAASQATGKVTGSKSDDLSTTTIIGIAAGALVGAIIIGGIIAWIIRQVRRSKTRADAQFDRNSFIRNSVLLDDKNESSTTLGMDEKPGYGGGYGGAATLAPPVRSVSKKYGAPPGSNMSGGPQPPTMIQRHYDAPALQPGQYSQYPGGPAAPPNAYYPPGGMPMRSPFANGPAKDLPASPGADSFYTQVQAQAQGGKYYPGQYRQNNGQNSPVPSDLGRAPTYKSQGSDHAELTREPSQGKGRSGRGLSVTPFQAQQYAEISRLVNQPLPPNQAGGEAYELPARSVASPPPNVRSPPPIGRPMDMSPSGFRSPSPPSPVAPPRNLVSPFQRIGSVPPMLPPLITSSHPSDASLGQFNSDRSLNTYGRSGTPTDPNPQQYFTNVRSASPQDIADVRGPATSGSYPTLVDPHNSPQTPRFHSGVSAVSHSGEAGNFGSAGNLNSMAQSRSGGNLAVPGQGDGRRLSVRNSMVSDGRYSMYGEEDVYGGI